MDLLGTIEICTSGDTPVRTSMEDQRQYIDYLVQLLQQLATGDASYHADITQVTHRSKYDYSIICRN